MRVNKKKAATLVVVAVSLRIRNPKTKKLTGFPSAYFYLPVIVFLGK